MKWPDELAPKAGKTLHEATEMVVTVGRPVSWKIAAGQSVYVEMKLHAQAEGRLAMRVMDAENPARSCEFQLDFGKQRMQISPCGADGTFHPEIQTIREGLKTMPQEHLGWGVRASHGIHAGSQNFCLENVDVLNGTFTLKVIVRYSPKMRCTVFDAEVAGQRTLISNRVRLKADALQLATDSQSIAFDKIEIKELLG